MRWNEAYSSSPGGLRKGLVGGEVDKAVAALAVATARSTSLELRGLAAVVPEPWRRPGRCRSSRRGQGSYLALLFASWRWHALPRLERHVHHHEAAGARVGSPD